MRREIVSILARMTMALRSAILPRPWLRLHRLAPVIQYTGGKKGWVGDVPYYKYSIEKLAGIGWQPQYSAKDAMRRSVREICVEAGLTCSS